jgi:hypothetical protein
MVHILTNNVCSPQGRIPGLFAEFERYILRSGEGRCRFHYFVAKISVLSVHFGPFMGRIREGRDRQTAVWVEHHRGSLAPSHAILAHECTARCVQHLPLLPMRDGYQFIDLTYPRLWRTANRASRQRSSPRRRPQWRQGRQISQHRNQDHEVSRHSVIDR